MPYSPQERQRRSELAKRLHREGKFGGPQPAKRSVEVRARRASELAQQLVHENAAAVERTLREILRDGTPGQRLRAVEALLKLGLAAERLAVTEHKSATEHMDRQQLIDTLADKLSGNSMAGQLVRARLAEGAIDSTAVEVAQP